MKDYLKQLKSQAYELLAKVNKDKLTDAKEYIAHLNKEKLVDAKNNLDKAQD